MIEIYLDAEQKEELETEFDKVRDAANRDKPGMLLAQIGTSGTIRVGFVNHKDAVRIQKIIGRCVGESGTI